MLLGFIHRIRDRPEKWEMADAGLMLFLLVKLTNVSDERGSWASPRFVAAPAGHTDACL